MNYHKHYNLLINLAKDRPKLVGYVERHHIVPRCMGGTDDPENLVDLTPEEHYTAHLLLAKMYPNVSGLWFACHMMSITRSKPGRSGNKSYGYVRRNYANHIATTIKETWAKKRGFSSYVEQVHTIWDVFTQEKVPTKEISKRFGIPVNKVNGCLHDYVVLHPSEAGVLEQTRFELKSKESKKTRANISKEAEQRRLDAVKAADYTERNKRFSIERRGSGNPNRGGYQQKLSTCPHCGAVGGSGGMHRWHFDNCKDRL